MDLTPSNDQQRHELVRNELTRRGLPLAYIERLLSELDDHFVDLLAERNSPMGAARKLQSEESNATVKPSRSGRGQGEGDSAATSSGTTFAQKRLGEPAHLALFAAEQYFARSFWGRHPVVTFLLAPLPLLVLGWVVTGLGVTGAGKIVAYICAHWLGMSESSTHPGDHLIAQAAMMVAVSWLLIVVPPLAVAWLLCRIAVRNALHWRWPIASCALLAFVAGCLAVSYRLAVQPREGQFMVGLSFALSPQWLLLYFLPKFVLAIGIGYLLLTRARQQAAFAS